MDNISNEEIIKNKNAWLKEKLQKYYQEYGSEDTINQFEEDILNIHDPELSYFFADTIGGNVARHGKIVIESKNPEYNYSFAKFVSGADIKAHEQVVLESKDPRWNYQFAKEVFNFDQKALNIHPREAMAAHEQVVLDSKDPYYNYCFAVNLSGAGADLKAHEQVVIESKDPKYNYEFAKYVWSDNKNSIKAHEQAILESKDPEYNYNFAFYFINKAADVDVRAHGKVVLESKNLKYNYAFATIPGADYDAHAQLIIDSGDPEYNYKFCEYIKNSNFIDHARVVMQSDREDYKSELREKYEYELKRSNSVGNIKRLIKELSNE